MRRALPPGGEVAKDYRFLDKDGKEHGLADLFGQHDTLISYFWMYGPQRERPCPMCTAFLDSFDAAARNLTQRVAIAVIGRSPVSRQLAFAVERGWRFLDFYQMRRRRLPDRLSRAAAGWRGVAATRRVDAPGRDRPAFLGRVGNGRDRRPGQDAPMCPTLRRCGRCST